MARAPNAPEARMSTALELAPHPSGTRTLPALNMPWFESPAFATMLARSELRGLRSPAGRVEASRRRPEPGDRAEGPARPRDALRPRGDSFPDVEFPSWDRASDAQRLDSLSLHARSLHVRGVDRPRGHR